jgi:predicted aspartyl protease
LIKHATFLAASVAIALAVTSIGARAASSCKLLQIDEWPVRLERNRVLVDGQINGQKIGVMLDTGAMRSLIPRSAADRLGLERRQTPYMAQGVGGESYFDVVHLREFRIRQAVRNDWRVYITGEKDLGPNVGFILGEDFFAQADVEFDLAHNVVRLFQPKDCNGMSLAYWAPSDASEIAIARIDDFHPQIVLQVLVNGQPVKAQLDSGSSISVLNRSAAARLGVTPETAGVVPIGKATGIGPQAVDSWIAPFESVVIGDERIKDTAIAFADMYDSNAPHQHPMLLGADFLIAHRVLVAHSQRKIYFTYNGGPVFQRFAPPKASVVSRAESGTSVRAIADRGASRSNQ